MSVAVRLKGKEWLNENELRVRVYMSFQGHAPAPAAATERSRVMAFYTKA